jgi:hypothetical protein
MYHYHLSTIELNSVAPIEAERRRRVWWLIHNADKYEAVAAARPVLLRSDEFMGPGAARLPIEM